jgi:mono/diheme cytochrome c family protein
MLERNEMISRVAVSLGALLLIGVSVLAQQRGAAPAARPAAAAPAARPVAAMPPGDLEHGRYLVERVVMCFECHSSRDEQGNIIPTTRFLGGPMPIRPPWPGDWPEVIPRIAGLPGYNDEQAMRLLTQGAIKRDGSQLRRPMPPFRMTPQDAADVIAYIRTR